MSNKTVSVIVFALILFGAAPSAEAKKGGYVGAGPVYNSIKGDFNGNSALRMDTEVIIIPEIDNDLGLDIRGGYGFTDAWALELNLMASDHDGKWGGRKRDVTFVSFSINGKYSFAADTPTQPYLLFGISGNSLIIENGADDTATGEIDEASLTGPGFNFGAGIDHYLSPNLCLNMGFMYRFVEYADADGVHHSAAIEDKLNGSGVSFLLTTAYHF